MDRNPIRIKYKIQSLTVLHSYTKWPNQYHLKSLTILSIFIFTIFLLFHKFVLILIIIYTLSFIVFTLTFLL